RARPPDSTPTCAADKSHPDSPCTGRPAWRSPVSAARDERTTTRHLGAFGKGALSAARPALLTGRLSTDDLTASQLPDHRLGGSTRQWPRSSDLDTGRCPTGLRFA